MIKIFENYNFEKKKFDFGKVKGLQPATLEKTKHFHRNILIGLALIQNRCFAEDLPMVVIKERCEIHPVKQQNSIKE